MTDCIIIEDTPAVTGAGSLDVEAIAGVADASASVAQHDPQPHGAAGARGNPTVFSLERSVARLGTGCVESAVRGVPRRDQCLLTLDQDPSGGVKHHILLRTGAALLGGALRPAHPQ